ncbi:MAG: hypothetical protein GEV11_13050 [Streptosporangiales bacterium]|nr:hypothetical protein [Streptosporangiales bacterium]
MVRLCPLRLHKGGTRSRARVRGDGIRIHPAVVAERSQRRSQRNAQGWCVTGPQTADGRLIAGRYRLLSSSGERGLGTIWQAFDEALDREVVLDEIVLPQRLSRARRAEVRAGLLRAARLASRLEHPAAAKVHDVLEEQGQIWVISEQVPGHPLAELLGEGPLPPRMAAEIGGELLGALVAAHAIGLLHGDVRPGNVWITDEGRVALTGFGTSGAGQADDIRPLDDAAPEISAGRLPGPPADLFGLGRTLLTAVDPAAAAAAGGLAPENAPTAGLSAGALRAGPGLRGQPGGPLAWLIEGLLRPDPDERMTASRARRHLTAVATGRPFEEVPDEPVPSPPPGAFDPVRPQTHAEPPSKHRRSLVGALVVTVAALGAAIVGWTMLGGGSGAPQAGTTPPPGTTSPKAKPSATPSTDPAADLLHPYRDDSGFEVELPGNDWRHEDVKDEVVFTHKETGSVLRIQTNDDPGALNQLVGGTRQQLDRTLGEGYRQGRVRTVAYRGTRAVDWRFLWTRGDKTYQGSARAVVMGEKEGYVLLWTTADDRWKKDYDQYQSILQSFQPAGKD